MAKVGKAELAALQQLGADMKALRDVVVETKTTLVEHVRADQQWQENVQHALVERRDDAERKHGDNRKDTADLRISVETSTEKLHSRISDISKEMSTAITGVSTEMRSAVTGGANEMRSTVMKAVGWGAGLVGTLLMLLLGAMGYLLVHGTPYHIENAGGDDPSPFVGSKRAGK